MYNVTASNAAGFTFKASDDTVVEFVKITSRDRIQVRFPADHALADGQGAGRIFRRDGSHFKDRYDVTISAIAKPVAAPTPTLTASTPVAAAAPAPVVANDTPVTAELVVVDPFAGIETEDLDGTLVVIRGKAFRLEADDSYNNIIVLAA